MPEEMSNTKLFNRPSLETIAMVLVFTFGTGGAWFVLAGDVETNATTNEEIKREQTEVKRDIGEIKADVAGIKASQQHQARDIERILRILEHDPR